MGADIVLTAGDVGVLVPFILNSLSGTPVSAASALTATWVAEDGRRRPLTLLSAGSALWGYTLSAGDYPGPRFERGQLLVSQGALTFWVSAFTVQVLPHV